MIPITPLLHLVLMNENHIAPLYELALNNKKFLSKWLPWPNQMKDLEFMRNNILNVMKEHAEGKSCAFAIADGQALIGRIGLYHIAMGKAEIGYWLAEQATGKGIATKATASLMNYGHQTIGIKTFTIECEKDNVKSQQVAIRNNFKLTNQSKGFVQFTFSF
ncbi:MAG: hypothetical protein RIQ89_70 [Bacteroidota bacterium]|jgi:ribosomal-protein-serine acetyltransferase